MEKKKIGAIMWHDLAVPNAEVISDFYRQVIGWERSALNMGDYNDYILESPDTPPKAPAAGVSHTLGNNSYLPPQWLMYVTVDNLDKSLEQCNTLGGQVIGPKRKLGERGFFCLIQDPAGAYVMLCEE
jgi:predicted enzyme related to lactoylglutathione lyase